MRKREKIRDDDIKGGRSRFNERKKNSQRLHFRLLNRRFEKKKCKELYG